MYDSYTASAQMPYCQKLQFAATASSLLVVLVVVVGNVVVVKSGLDSINNGATADGKGTGYLHLPCKRGSTCHRCKYACAAGGLDGRLEHEPPPFNTKDVRARPPILRHQPARTSSFLFLINQLNWGRTLTLIIQIPNTEIYKWTNQTNVLRVEQCPPPKTGGGGDQSMSTRVGSLLSPPFRADNFA